MRGLVGGRPAADRVALCTREALPGLRARGMVANPHGLFESSVIWSLEAAFAIRVRPGTSAWGRQYLGERGEAWRVRGRSDSGMGRKKRSMSGARQSLGRGPHVYARRALLEELRAE
jgi:hypothetical protein